MIKLPTAELELLMRCSRSDAGVNDRASVVALLSGGIDWYAILVLASLHGLSALLDRTLRAVDSSNVPGEVLSQLRDRSQATRFRSFVLAQELHRALDVLERAGVVATPYKGPALSVFLYHDVGVRESGDIDILVRPADALRAHRALAQNRFAPHETPFGPFFRLHAQLHCSFSFTALESKALLEMNWRAAPWYWQMPEISENAWDQLSTLSVADRPVRWFQAEYVLLALCVHGCKHKWELIKWIVDVADLLRAHGQLDWSRVTEIARATRAERILRLGLFLAWDLLDAPLPDHIVDFIKQDALTCRLAQEVYSGIFATSSASVDLIEQLRFLAEVAERRATKVCCRALVPAYLLLHRIVRPAAAGLRQVLGKRVLRETVKL